jgi:tol-pal system protein YbgF
MYMMRRMQRSVAARVMLTMAAAVALGSCATKGDLRDLQTEIRSLAARQDTLLAQLRIEALSTQDSVRTLSDQIFDFRGEITRQLREIGQSLATIEALSGQNQRAIAGVRDQMANQRRPDPSPPPGAAVDSTSVLVEGSGGGDPQALYRTAVDQMGRGSLNTARAAFEEFLTRHPNHELAPDAHFYVADVMYQQENFEQALEAFQEIQSRFPTATRVPDSLYRIALIQIEMDDVEAAEQTLQRIVNTYPGTITAELAGDKLEEIG